MKPLKIKKFNIKTKSKVIAQVYWSHLRGNQQPYLSVQIIQVMKNGKNLTNWGKDKAEYDNTIKELSPDIYDLYKAHLLNPDGEGMHELSYTWYKIQQTKKYLFNKPTTIEQKTARTKRP